MDTKHIHCMLEKIAEYGKQMMEAAVGAGSVNLDDAGKIVDMVKDLAEAEYHALIAKAMRKSEEDDEAEEKYIRKMLKEEHEDEYRRMREEYGEDEGERRFYDNYRYANGRFAPKGTGSYRPRSSGRRGRRGYEESFIPMDYRMDMEDYTAYPPEYWRDVDRQRMNRLYYTDGGSGGSYGGNSGGNSSQSGNMGGGQYGGNSGGSVRGYSDGYNDGYSEGERNGRRQGGDSRYDRARRGYEETKQQHKGNSPEDKQLTMREMEKVLGVVFDEIDEMLEDASPEMKNMVKTKTMSRMQKIQ